ncbi:hypothetical protein SAMN05192573_112116 [Mucilaginibacter gossypii]|uniref:Uncharacterized protein n=1 Tax=Mucilaginibacter gossypii TaxID=551996 RepID=A0A1G8F158_9SPHI|nr:hypothetical protein SAMN05192573_112116 [Mucilaginibacter gossypii]
MYYDIKMVDNQIIWVDYSEIETPLTNLNDFQLILFPDSPPNLAICITNSVSTDDTFAEELND